MNYVERNNIRYNLCVNMLLLSVLFTPLRSYSVLIIAGHNVTFFRLFGTLMIFFTFILFFVYNEHIIIDEFLLILFFIVMYNLISLFYSANVGASHFFSMTFGLVWLIFAYLLLSIRIDATLKLIKVLLYSSIFPIGWGTYQYVYFSLYKVLPREIFPSLLVSDELVPVMYNIFMRISSTFIEPNYYGMYLVIINIICLGLLIDRKESMVLFGKKFIYFVTGLYFITLFAVLQTLSLSAMLGLILTTLIALTYKERKFIKIFLFVFVFVFTIIILYIFIDIKILDIMQFRISNRAGSYDMAFGRIDYFNNAINKIADSPLLGVGFGNLSIDEGIVSSAHNTLLTVFGQQGIIGFILHLILLFIYPVINIFMNYDYGYRNISLTVYFSVLGMIIVSFGYDAMYKLDVNFVILLIMAMFCRYSKKHYIDNNVNNYD